MKDVQVGLGHNSEVRAPLVTVVVINYNYGRYLETCLDSVLNQSYVNIECIIIDNSSSDNSPEIIKSYEEKFVQIGVARSLRALMLTENIYLTGACVRGFEEARGSYVVFLDADDYLLTHCIETHILAHLSLRVAVGVTAVDMCQSNETDLVVMTSSGFSEYVMSGEGQKTKFARMDALPVVALSRFDTPAPLEPEDLHLVQRSNRHWVWSPTSGLCFRHDALQFMLGGYKPKMRANTDSYLLGGICALTGGVTIDRPLAVYRIHGSNIFTKHPHLANFRSYDPVEHAVNERNYTSEIIACYLANARSFNTRLVWVGYFFDAVATVSKSTPYLERTRGDVSDDMAEFMIVNRNLLIEHFGEAAYRTAVRRHMTLRDRLVVLKDRIVARWGQNR